MNKICCDWCGKEKPNAYGICQNCARFPKLYRKCINCGYCCKQAPCSFGTIDKEKGYCKFLSTKDNKKYYCDIFKEILEKPGSDISPAFGASCCSPLNDDRRNAIAE